MLELITGKPGNGKTLYMISRAHQEYVQANPSRKVYYHNIEGVTLEGFHHLEDPHQWMKCEPGSVIIIDEVHKVWPQRVKGDPHPSCVQLAEHRHYGIDLLLATQDPADLDIFARRRCGRHRHFVRPFEAGHATHFEWQNCEMDPFDRGAQKKALRHNFKLNPAYFGTYESTDQDTHKRKLPWKKLAPIAACAVGIVALVVFVITMIGGWTDNAKIGQDTAEAADRAASAADTAASAADRAASALEAMQRQFEARIEGQPWSAPFYEDHVEARSMPIVSGCSHWIIGKQVRCECTDQLGEPVQMPRSYCEHIMRNGFDHDWSGERRRILEENRAYISSVKGGAGSAAGSGGGDASARASSFSGGARAPEASSSEDFPF